MIYSMSKPSSQETGDIPLDRWVEIDLYWFERENIASRVEEFWDRCMPLFEGVGGERGVILNIGWLVDFVTEWNGDPDSRISFPQKMTTQHYTVDLPNRGTTAERMDNWRRRFEQVEFVPLEYPAWTYADVADLVRSLKEEAARRGLGGMRVGTFVVGWASIYEGEESAFARRHPEAFWPTCNGRRCFNPESRLIANSAPVAAFAEGVREGTRAIDFFASQWGHLSRAVGFDALVLRDSILGMGDIVSLVERAQQQFDEKEAREMQRKIAKNTFDFNDFLSQIQQIKKMGNVKDLMGMIPGMGKMLKDVEIGDDAFKSVEAIIGSMTPKERAQPNIIDGSRRKRIAKGSGTDIQEVNRLLKQFEDSKKMMKLMSNKTAMSQMMRKMPGGR
jgi:hypothetical protein